MMAALSSPSAVISGQPLNNTVAGEHAAVDREVAADHKGTHGCILLGQAAGFVREICLILASIDQNQASVAVGIAVALIAGVPPPSAPAKACKEASVSCVIVAGRLDTPSIGRLPV